MRRIEYFAAERVYKQKEHAWAPTQVGKWEVGVKEKFNTHNKRFLRKLFYFTKKVGGGGGFLS